MTAAAKNSFGAKFYMAADGITPLVLVAELLTIAPPQLERGMQDATTHDGGQAEEFIPEGVYNAGEVSGSMHYIAGSAGDDAMLAALTGGGLMDCKVVLKAATGTEDLTFSGYVSSYGPDEMEIKGKQVASFTVKLTGAITQGVSA